MLVLARRKQQAAIVVTRGVAFRMKVVESGKRQVRIGYDAPQGVRIFREELAREIDTSGWPAEDREALQNLLAVA